VGCSVLWGIALWKITETTRSLPNAGDGVELADAGQTPKGRVCVVIPAHNEEGEIAALVSSLKGQAHPDASFVLALDRCTDRTRAIAEDAIGGDDRFEIVEINECPDGWAGKVHAAWTGFSESKTAQSSEFLVFTDADCRFDPRCLEATLALLDRRGLDFLSLHSDQSSVTWFERCAQPVACMELLRQYPLSKANRHDENARPFANGQFMLFRRSAYDSIGGHSARPAQLLEDIHFARHVRRAGFKGGLLASGGMLSCRMYDTWSAFRRGWKRIYTEAANRKSKRLRTAAMRLRLAVGLVPALAIVGGLSWWPLWNHAETWMQVASLAVHVIAIGLWATASVAFARAGRIPISGLMSWPLGAWLVGGILVEAAADLEAGTPTEWGGRTYDRPDRTDEANQDEADPKQARPVETPA